MEHQKRLPRKVVDSPSLDIFKSHLVEIPSQTDYMQSVACGPA